MKLILNHKVTNRLYEVTTDTDDPDKPVKPTYPANPAILSDEIQAQLGFYGHLISLEETTNLDLHHACLNLPSFDLIESEGVPSPNPLPEGVQT